MVASEGLGFLPIDHHSKQSAIIREFTNFGYVIHLLETFGTIFGSALFRREAIGFGRAS